jgi:hypothetical protein
LEFELEFSTTLPTPDGTVMMSVLEGLRVIRFGFSAFLKFWSLNAKPQQTELQQTELRKRLAPSSGGGYDFHSSLRRQARRYLAGGEPLANVLTSAGTIKRPVERLSARRRDPAA